MTWHNTSSHSRGYGYAWQKLRQRALERDHGLCQPCKRAGRITEADAVDHIIRKAECKRRGHRSDYLDNLQSICNECHDRKTAEENGRSGEPKQVIGLDGWPKA